jgi:ABC-type transport system substrate-binding protein
VFLPLVEESHDEQKPALAERWEHSPDYKIWTFYLRKDVRWHDGVTTTAHDIKFSLDLMDEVVQFKQMQGIASYEVIDDFTFAITYKKPSIYALDYWSVYWPKHLLEDLDTKEFWKWDFWTQPVGNGPYRYVRHVPKTMIELEANQDYYKGKPKIRKVILKFGEGAPLTELLSGNVDVIQAFPSDVPKLRDDPRFHVYYKRTWHVGTILTGASSPGCSTILMTFLCLMGYRRHSNTSMMTSRNLCPMTLKELSSFWRKRDGMTVTEMACGKKAIKNFDLRRSSTPALNWIWIKPLSLSKTN